MVKYKTEVGSIAAITLEEVKRLVNKHEWDDEVWDAFFEFVEFECDAAYEYVEADDIQRMADSVVVLDKDDILRIQQEHGTVPDHELDDDELMDSVDTGQRLRWIAPISQRQRVFQVLQYYAPSAERRDRRPSVVCKLDSWSDPDGGNFMAVGVLVPGVAFWEELWNEDTGWVQTTLKDTPCCTYTKGLGTKVAETLWDSLSRGDIVVATHPDFSVLANLFPTPDKPMNSVIAIVSARFPEVFPKGWVDNTRWHDEWHTVLKDELPLFDFSVTERRCPFCGTDDAARIHENDPREGFFRVVCDHCHVNGVASSCAEGAWHNWDEMDRTTRSDN